MWKLVCVSMMIIAAGAPRAPAEDSKETPPGEKAASRKEAMPTSPGKVDVQPLARDDQIRTRLLNVLDATGCRRCAMK